MSAAPEDPSVKLPVDLEEDEEALDREAILARRASLVRLAVRTLGVAVVGAATASCIPCLSPVAPPRDAAIDAADADANPQPCLAPLPPDAEADAGVDGGTDGGNG